MARRPDETEEEAQSDSDDAPARSPRWIRAGQKRTIDRLDDRERRLSFLAAGLAALFGIIVYAAETSNPHFRLAKNQLTPQTTLILGLAAGALLLVATLVGRRAPVGFVALFTFLAFGTQYLLGVPFLALAVWLLYRSFKVQRELAAEARAARSETAPSRASTSAGSGRSASRAPSTPKGSRSKGAGARAGNKRYTPKRPTPPPPKPSWRERKAARAERPND